MATPLTETGITTEDLVALLTNTEQRNGVSRTEKPAGNATLDAVSAAIGKQGVALPTQPVNKPAQAAIDAASIASEELRATAQNAKTEMAVLQKDADNIYTRQQEAVQKTGAAKEIIGEQAAVIEARNLDIRRQTIATEAQIRANNAFDTSKARERYDAQLDDIAALDAEKGFVGFLKQVFLRPGMVDDANETSSIINARNRLQTQSIESAKELSDAQITTLPTKTPAMLAAEAETARQGTELLVNQSKLQAISDKEQHFKTAIDTQNAIATAAGTEAGRLLSISHAEFSARVDAIKSAADGAAKIAALMQARDAVGGEVNTNIRIEDAFNLARGEGANWMKRLERADPEAAAAVLEASYSGETSNDAALARALRYSPPQQHSASMRLLADKVSAKEAAFNNYLQVKGVDGASFKKLPLAEQKAVRTAFNATSQGEVTSTLIDSTTAAISRTVAASVPDGIISVPAILNKEGQVVRDARKISLLPTGKLGKQFAELNGDATAAYELAKLAVTEEGRAPDEVAREYANFFQNALTVEAAFRGNERRKFGLPMATTFPSNISEEGYFGGAEIKKLDHASYPAVLTCLIKAKTAKLTQGVREGIAPMGVTSQMTGTEFVPGVK